MSWLLVLVSVFLLPASACGHPLETSIVRSETDSEQVLADEPTEGEERDYRASFEEVWDVTLDVLGERGEAIDSIREEEGLVSTNKTTVDTDRLEVIADTSNGSFGDGGWYTLSIRITELAELETRVVIEPFIVGTDPERDNIWGGVPLESTGALETEILTAIANELGDE